MKWTRIMMILKHIENLINSSNVLDQQDGYELYEAYLRDEVVGVR